MRDIYAGHVRIGEMPFLTDECRKKAVDGGDVRMGEITS
jgi:hypothetical protein